MSNRSKEITLICLVIVLVGISVALFIRYSACQERCELQEQRIGNLQTKIASQKQEIDSLQKENANQEQAIEALEEKLAGALPYGKANGSAITLQDNYGNVQNPTWAELMSFLESDNTESIRYDYTSFVCGDFAERLHNNAEREGIRAGVVIVHFIAGSPHALNVFYTTDKGLVYIDCSGSEPIYTYDIYTGTTTTDASGEDKVAYMVQGKEYGLVPMDYILASSFPSGGYHIYESFVESWESYNRRVEDYNTRVDKHNSNVEWYNRICEGIWCSPVSSYCVELDTGELVNASVFFSLSNSEQAYLNKKGVGNFMEEQLGLLNRVSNVLEMVRLSIEDTKKQLGDYWYESPGIVTSIEIYWNAMVWGEPR